MKQNTNYEGLLEYEMECYWVIKKIMRKGEAKLTLWSTHTLWFHTVGGLPDTQKNY